MPFSSVLSFLLSTHSVDCAVPLLLSIHCPFTSVHRTNCAVLTVRSYNSSRQDFCGADTTIGKQHVCSVGQLI